MDIFLFGIILAIFIAFQVSPKFGKTMLYSFFICGIVLLGIVILLIMIV